MSGLEEALGKDVEATWDWHSGDPGVSPEPVASAARRSCFVKQCLICKRGGNGIPPRPALPGTSARLPEDRALL